MSCNMLKIGGPADEMIDAWRSPAIYSKYKIMFYIWNKREESDDARS
jgi:hypothetical protein